MKWISVKKALPEIPKDKCCVSVLVCCYDPIYDEYHPNGELNIPESNGRGLFVNRFVNYGEYIEYFFDEQILKFGFHEMIDNGDTSIPEQVTHWMYLPEPPKYKAAWDKEKQHLEFIYYEE